MAAEANAIRGRSRQLRWVADGLGIRRLGVFLAGAVTGLAAVSGGSPLFVRLDQIVRPLGESFGGVFVAGPARIRSGIWGGGGLSPGSTGSQQHTNAQQRCVKIAHEPC